MTQRERLIELLMDVPADGVGLIADFLLANGVIVPPVKVGDVIFATPINERNICEFEVATITVEPKDSPIKHSYVCYGGWCFSDRHWGETVFRTRAEAEERLSAMRKGGLV